MGLLPDALPGHLSVSDAAVRDRLGKLWGAPPPAEPGLSYEQMIGGSLRALYVMGANPAADSLTAEALDGLDFLVVQDLFLTETAQLADVVLPAASFAEAEGTYTNLERRVQRGPQGISPVGDSRADWQILATLAERWQTAQSVTQTFEVSETSKVSDVKTADWKKKKQKAKVGPASKPWNYPTIGTVLDEIGKAVPAYAGIRWETLGEGGLQWNAERAGAAGAPRGAGRDRGDRGPGRGQLPAGEQPGAVGWRHVDGARRRTGAQSHGGAVHRVESRRPGRGRPGRRPDRDRDLAARERGAAAAGRRLGAARHSLDSIGPDRRAGGDARRRQR